ncbi:MAG TPA: hypothetical protein VGJ42_01915 [Nitrososphaera sp.]
MSVEPLIDRWIGIKMLAYNISQSVERELWVDDKANNNWVKIAKTTNSAGGAA